MGDPENVLGAGTRPRWWGVSSHHPETLVCTGVKRERLSNGTTRTHIT
jgi:hypothetical protein